MEPYFDRVAPAWLDGPSLDYLLALGWFRMHQELFTCSHVDMEGLHRVHWLRYAVKEVTETRATKKIRRRTSAFRYSIDDLRVISVEHMRLHARYFDHINFDGAPSIQECLFGEAIELKNIFNTKCISIYDGDKLIAAGYFDVGQEAVASILHFFDPDYRRFSLGKLLMLITLDYMRSAGLTWYYPGYLVEGLSKMNYKLFLGEQVAQYYEPITSRWFYFDPVILSSEPPANEQNGNDIG